MLKKSLYILFLTALFLIWLFLAFTPYVKIQLTTKAFWEKCELFYAKPQPTLHSQRQKVKKRAKGKEDKKELKFRLPFATPCNQFRLDLGEHKGNIFILHKLEVCSIAGFWKKNIDFGSSKGIMLNYHLQKLKNQEDGLNLLTTGSNPFLIINLPQTSQFHFSFCNVLILLLFIAAAILPFILEKSYSSIFRYLSEAKTKLHKKLQTFPFLHLSPYWLLAVLFILLCAFGLTGSSIGLSRNSCVADPVGEKLLLGKYQPIRSDEFIAHGTASAVQSYKNKEQFSVINRQIGLSGRNFLFLHDGGAPVKHPAMLIRPANWLFFITGMKHALAWYWWFPVFFGIFSVLFLLNTLFKNDPWFHLIIALGVVFCPYSAGWSFWPINCSAGAFLAVGALIRMCRSNSLMGTAGFALLAGWSFSVSAATLYFPHIWPCVSLALLIGLCEIIRILKEKKYCIWKNISGFLLFLIIAGLLMFIFFYAIREPVSLAMKSAISARIRHGGLFEVWELFRGWLFPITFYKQWYFNQSEDQAFQLILLPLLFCFVWQYKTIRNRPLCYVLFAFIFWALIYQFVGLPAFLTNITGWSRCTEPRVCYAIQVAQCFLLAALAQQFELEEKCKRFLLAMGLSLMIFSAAMIFLREMPDHFWFAAKAISWQTLAMYITITISIFAAVNIMILYHVKWGAVVFSLILFAAGLGFHPLCIAPRDFQSPLVNEIKKMPGQKYGGRVLFSANSISSFHSQNYVMSGGKVFNSFFCYEDVKIHDLLLKNLPNGNLLHRLNHMSVKFVPKGKNLTAEIPLGDCIRLNFNGRNFDFSKLPIDFIINLIYNGTGGLEDNKTVQHYKDIGLWQIWRVKH